MKCGWSDQFQAVAYDQITNYNQSVTEDFNLQIMYFGILF